MTTLAIIGAGPGLGLAVARRFGREGLAVALISRNQGRVDELAATLTTEGISAAGFAANVRDGSSLVEALEAASAALGPIEVLQYSPLPAKEFMRPVLETTAADLVGPIEFSVYGPVTAARQVIPGMRSLGGGSILFVNGASAVKARDAVTGTSIAFAGESAYAELLHDAVAPDIHVGQLIIPRGIGNGEESHAPETLADTLWRMHAEKGEFRVVAAALSGDVERGGTATAGPASPASGRDAGSADQGRPRERPPGDRRDARRRTDPADAPRRTRPAPRAFGRRRPAGSEHRRTVDDAGGARS